MGYKKVCVVFSWVTKKFALCLAGLQKSLLSIHYRRLQKSLRCVWLGYKKVCSPYATVGYKKVCVVFGWVTKKFALCLGVDNCFCNH